jgi:hypothetical protein
VTPVPDPADLLTAAKKGVCNLYAKADVAKIKKALA